MLYWTVMNVETSVREQGSSWNEYSIGHTIYGAPQPRPPIFTSKEKAQSYKRRNKLNGPVVSLEVSNE